MAITVPRAPSVLQQWVKDRIAEKKGSQPLAAASAGCIFKNPRNISARMLMQRSGVSGVRVRGAEVSDLHPNFIVTHPSATAQDVLDLAEHIRHTVADRMHINLEFEVEVW